MENRNIIKGLGRVGLSFEGLPEAEVSKRNARIARYYYTEFFSNTRRGKYENSTSIPFAIFKKLADGDYYNLNLHCSWEALIPVLRKILATDSHKKDGRPYADRYAIEAGMGELNLEWLYLKAAQYVVGLEIDRKHSRKWSK